LLWRVTGLEEIKPGRELTRTGWRFFWAAGFLQQRERKFCRRRRISVQRFA
jgi:hypothetical protein